MCGPKYINFRSKSFLQQKKYVLGFGEGGGIFTLPYMIDVLGRCSITDRIDKI